MVEEQEEHEDDDFFTKKKEKEKTVISKATVHNIKLLLGKSIYYNDDNALIQLANIFAAFDDKPEEIMENIKKARQTLRKIGFNEEDINLYHMNMKFIPKQEFNELEQEKRNLSINFEDVKSELINYIFQSAEKHKLKIELSKFFLSDLPLYPGDDVEEEY